MIIDEEEFLQGLFDQVYKDKIDSQEKKITVFCLNQDVDSLCCCYMLQSLFFKQNTYFSAIPVESYAAIQEKFSREFDPESTEPRTCIFLNCGANMNIRDLVDLNDSIRAVIIDSHRPIHHSYNNDDDNMVCVVIAPDDYVNKHEVPGSDQMYEYLEAASDEDEDEEEQAAKAARGEADDDVGQKRRELREQRAARMKEVVEYYQQGSSYGKPSALLVYDLLRSQGQESTHVLWLAILGLTDAFLNQRVDAGRYDTWRMQLRDHAAAQGHRERTGEIELEEAGRVRKPQHEATIRDGMEFRFTMYRKWSLYEGMRWTPYIAARLQTWQDKGLGNLHKLLALTGITLEEAKKQYTAMRPEQIDKLDNNLQKEAHKVLLAPERFKLESFQLSLNYETISAADHCMAITALLARAEAASSSDAFWEAQQALDLKQGVELLQTGINLAKEMQTNIIKTIGLAIQMKQARSSKNRSMMMLNLQAANINNPEQYQHPAVLVQMSYFLREALLIVKSNTLPCVLVGPANGSGQCYVAGVRRKLAKGAQLNPFSLAFEKAAELAGILPESVLDASVVLIAADEVDLFLESLDDAFASVEQGRM